MRGFKKVTVGIDDAGELVADVEGRFRKILGSFGPQGQAFKHIAVPFTFDTEGLANGIEIYTPKIGEYIYDGWVEIIEAWDVGKGDLGCAGTYGFWWGANSDYIDMTKEDFAWTDYFGNILLSQNPPMRGGDFSLSGGVLFKNNMIARFASTDPLLFWVTSDGDPTSNDPGATQGSAIFHLIILT